MRFTKLASILSLLLAAVVYAETPAPPDAPAPKPSPILKGRPDANVVVDDLLGPEFHSLAAGIAFRPPANGLEIRRAVGGDDVVQFHYEKEHWDLTVTRMVLAKGAPLVTDTEKNKDGIIREGLLDTMAQQLKVDTGGAEILREDPINVIDTPVGMIAARYSMGSETRLTQRALVQGSDQETIYYKFDFTTPAPRTGPIENDPACKKTVDLFSHVVESIHLLDQSQLIKDKNDRLFFTQSLLVNITEPKIRKSLIPERWLRVLRDGKDVGYTYVVEEVAAGLPHKGEAPIVQTTNAAGVRIGVRSRSFPEPGVQVDGESWSWVAMDKKQEEWSNVVVREDSKVTDPKKKKVVATESGVAIWRIKPVKDDMMQSPNNKGIRMSDDYKLSVTTGGGDPIYKSLPPFYLPRAMDHLLPRLLPQGERGYLFASYVSDDKEVVKRYIDVGKEGEYILAGKTIHAIPVRDRIGLEGSMTTNYVTPEGEYLGTINTDSKITILPTDAATLQQMWKEVNLTRPGDVEVPGLKPGDPK